MFGSVLNAMEVSGLMGVSKNKAYTLPIRQNIEGSRAVLFSKESVETRIKQGPPPKMNCTDFVFGDMQVTPFGAEEDL